MTRLWTVHHRETGAMLALDTEPRDEDRLLNVTVTLVGPRGGRTRVRCRASLSTVVETIAALRADYGRARGWYEAREGREGHDAETDFVRD